MRKTIVSVALAGSLGLAGIALTAPGASAQSASPGLSAGTSTTDRLAERVTRLKEALAGLVTGGTLTQAQADEVAGTLAEQQPGRGGRGGHGLHGGKVSAEATAAVLGTTVEELRTQREAGRTLAQIATAENVSRADLISGLVAAAQKQLDADVAGGTLTQAQADELSSGLTARVTEKVDSVGRDGGRR